LSNFEEIIAGSAEVYIAPTGTAFPDVDLAVAAPWVLMGTNGSLNTTEDGIVIAAEVTTEDFTPLGDIQAVKTWLTGYDQRVRFTLADMTLEMLSHAYGGPPTTTGNVTTTAPSSGNMGYKSLSLTRSGIPTQVAMTIRMAQSPYGSAAPLTQFELYRVSQIAAVEITVQKGTPMQVAFEYRVYRDPSGVGQVKAGNAAAV
jgi:hypothetical protein